MYLDWYHFQTAPFHVTPDPDFLFLSPSHKEAFVSLVHGIEAKQGLVAITGEIGVGKTTIIRSYLKTVEPEKLKTIYGQDTNLSFPDLLQLICRACGRDLSAASQSTMVDQIYHILLEECTRGRNVALIIDEAHDMPMETLNNIRMLSNLETEKEKLIQMVLIGQPELAHKLSLPELHHLDQRIVMRTKILPLTTEESLAYISHRLAIAATTEEPIFTQNALGVIIKHAKGIPRVLNILCTHALIAGFGHQQKPVSSRVVKEVIAEFTDR